MGGGSVGGSWIGNIRWRLQTDIFPQYRPSSDVQTEAAAESVKEDTLGELLAMETNSRRGRSPHHSPERQTFKLRDQELPQFMMMGHGPGIRHVL